MLSMIFMLLLFPAGLFPATEIPANDPYIQYYGRWDFTDPLAPTHSWPGVYIYAEFEGTSIGVKMADNFTYYNVFIDGELVDVFKGDKNGTTSYTLISGLEDTRHTFLFTKRCETAWTKFTFYGLILDDGKTLLPPAEKPVRKIEFIGDSFTSASGNEYTGTDSPPDGTEQYTNIYEGFGPIVARHYGAQYMMTGISGFGMVLDWTGLYSKNLPDYYDRALLYTAEPKWDFEQWQPNLVVIGLGLNDYSGFEGYTDVVDEQETELYKTTYHDFITTVRDVYPGVKILAVAAHLDWMQETISEVVEEENADGHEDVFYAYYPYYAGGYVNNGHPNVETHHKIADQLIAAIDTIDAWVPYDDTAPPVITQLPASPFMVYDTLYTLTVETDSYAFLRYDTEDKSYDEMEYEFTTTGKRTHSVTLSCEQGEQYTYYLRGMDVNGNRMQSSAVVSFQVDTLQAPIDWYHPDYPIRSDVWTTGHAPLGYGFDDVSEIDQVNTAYFRRSVNLNDLSSITNFSIKLKYDDGAVVYFNGEEIRRINMGGDTLSYDSRALESDEGIVSINFDSDELQLLKEGENVIGVEVHQFDDGENDLYFSCRVSIRVSGKSELVVDYEDDWLYFDSGTEPVQETKGSLSDVQKRLSRVPAKIRLNQNYPNPFNSATTISFEISEPAFVTLEVYNLLGRKIETLIQKRLEPGVHLISFDASGLPSGEYLVRLKQNK